MTSVNTTSINNDIADINKVCMVALYVAAGLLGILLLSIIARCCIAVKNNVNTHDGRVGLLRQLVFVS